jgi:hypothetical protein
MGEIQEIDVYIQDDGSVRIEVRGVKGAKCLDITAQMEELLGGDITARDLTDEYHEQAQEDTEEQKQDR